MQVEPLSPRAFGPPGCEVEPHTEAFYDALAAERFVLPWCPDCRRFGLPGNESCTECWRADLEWRPASGRGEVFSFVVFRRTFHPALEQPYNVAIIELTEGPRIVGAVVGVPNDLIHVGMAVVVTFTGARDGSPPIQFRTRGEA